MPIRGRGRQGQRFRRQMRPSVRVSDRAPDRRPSRADTHSVPDCARSTVSAASATSHLSFAFRFLGPWPYCTSHKSSRKHWSALGSLHMADTVETVNSAPLSLADFWDPLYDSFDVDLVVKVLSHTIFSKGLTAWTAACLSDSPQAHSLPSSSPSFTSSKVLAGPSRSLSFPCFTTWPSPPSVSVFPASCTATIYEHIDLQGSSNGTLACIATKATSSSALRALIGVTNSSWSPEVCGRLCISLYGCSHPHRLVRYWRAYSQHSRCTQRHGCRAGRQAYCY